MARIPLAATVWTLLFVMVYWVVYPAAFPLLSLIDAPHYTPFDFLVKRDTREELGLIVAVPLLSWLYYQLWRSLRQRQGVLGLILVGWLGASAALLMTYPGQSADMFDYAFRAHMLAHLGHNPIAVPPSAVVPYSQYPYLSLYTEVDPYGPLWHALGAGVHMAAGESLLANVLGFKLLGLAGMAVCGLLIYSLLRRLAPQHAEEGLALWLLNPLVLNESVGHGHNEVIMVAVILGGLWLLLRGQPRLGLMVVLMAGLVKATAWIVAPVACVWVLRQYGWRRGTVHLGVGGLAGLALIALAYAPFGGIEVQLEGLSRRSWWSAGTWAAVAYEALADRGWTHDDLLRQVIRPASLLFVLVAALVMIKVRELRAAAWGVVLAYLLIGSHWFQPWYGVTIVGLAAMAVNNRLTIYTLLFTPFMLWQAVMGPFIILQLGFPLPPGGGHALMAATTLLIPQLLALGLALYLSVKQWRGRPAVIQS